MLLSQVAERVYWFARYIERAENTARLMLTRHQLMLDLPKNVQPEWRILVDMLGVEEAFNATKKKANEKNVVAFVFGNKENPSSILSSIIFARENIRTSREVLPSEIWERLNSLYLSVVRRSGKDFPRSSRHKVLNNIVQACQQITGALLGTMNHDDAYQFIRLGRNIERADMSTRIIDVGSAHLGDDKEESAPYNNVMWMSILRSLSAYQMYRLHVKSHVSREAVLDFILMGSVFPRAVTHCLEEIESSVSLLPNNKKAISKIGTIKKELGRARLEPMREQKLHDFIDVLQGNLGDIHAMINETWFYPAKS